MKKQFEQKLGMVLEPEEKVVLAVSGGVDSMVLWHLFRQTRHSLVIAHCNFQLRGAESNADEAMVLEYARENEVVLSRKFDTVNDANERGLSIQMVARELRYQWFDELRKEHHCRFVVTAHHRDDQVETFLVQLSRGGSMASLAGISEQTEYRFRPLLFASKIDLLQYADDHQVPFRHDASNDSDDYLRNRIRHHMMPSLTEHFPEYQNKILSAMEEIRALKEWHQQSLEEWEEKVVIKQEDSIELDIEAIGTLDSPLHFLRDYLRQYGFHPDTVENLFQGLNGPSGKVFESPTHVLFKDRTSLILKVRNEEGVAERKYVKSQLDGMEDELLLASILPAEELTMITQNENTAFLDYDKLDESIIFRKWKQGDYFYPLGMKGKKKLSDFFTDLKLPIPEKEKRWLMISGEEICWIPGLRLDDRFKVTTETKRVLKLRYKEKNGERATGI